MKKSERRITIKVPEGARCGLFGGMPSSLNYFVAIKYENSITPSCIKTVDGITEYCFTELEDGMYHYACEKDGYTAVCQIINYNQDADKEIKLDIKLNRMAGNGYERGFITLNTPEFIKANMTSHRDAWGEEYSYLFCTPQFTRSDDLPGRHQQTTNDEMYDFIAGLDAECEYMHVFSLGKTPKYDFDMPLVLFTRENIAGKSLAEVAEIIRKNGKPTVQYTAQVHSIEPASTEGALAMMLALCNEYGKKVLDKVDVYIVPRINLDGAVNPRRDSPTTGEDMNRDYLRMNNSEIRTVTSAYNLFLPEVAIDGHEKLASALETGEHRCSDMELQTGSGSLNHPSEMTELTMKIALRAIKNANKLGLRSAFYSNLASAAGGSAGSSYYGTRNSLSFLVETPGGTSVGGLYMERRVLAQFTLASTVITYTAENSEQIISTVHGSREKLSNMGHVYDENNLITLEHGRAASGNLAVTMIHVPTGKVTDTAREISYDEHTVALATRTRPTAYVIAADTQNKDEILKLFACHAIPYYTIPADSRVKLRQYISVNEKISLSEEFEPEFKNGAYVLPNTVPSTVLSVIMEPDFNSVSKRKMSLYSMGLVSADENGRLPIYRYCHNLTNGKVDVN